MGKERIKTMSRTATVISFSTLVDFSTRGVNEATKFVRQDDSVDASTQRILLTQAKLTLEEAGDISGRTHQIRLYRTAFNLALLAMKVGKPEKADSAKLAEWSGVKGSLDSWETTISYAVSSADWKLILHAECQ